MSLSTILSLLSLLYSAVSPEIKAAALAELQKLAAAETTSPWIETLLQMAEAAVNALPGSLPST